MSVIGICMLVFGVAGVLLAAAIHYYEATTEKFYGSGGDAGIT